MPSIILECPHCGGEKIGFNLISQHEATLKPLDVAVRYRVLMLCQNCEEGVVGVFDHISGTGPKPTPLNCDVDPRKQGLKLAWVYPAPRHSFSTRPSLPLRL